MKVRHCWVPNVCMSEQKSDYRLLLKGLHNHRPVSVETVFLDRWRMKTQRISTDGYHTLKLPEKYLKANTKRKKLNLTWRLHDETYCSRWYCNNFRCVNAGTIMTLETFCVLIDHFWCLIFIKFINFMTSSACELSWK